ncbi:MAG: hypothetical protein KatS3mg052_2375 [Candidatus Roseilinea sp.]|nr:MAG: hypothetical protein KatS3mg052_2375 [Candidatus Roseilinea sp.]
MTIIDPLHPSSATLKTNGVELPALSQRRATEKQESAYATALAQFDRAAQILN